MLESVYQPINLCPSVVSGTAGATAALDTGTTTGLIVGGLSLAVSLGLTIYYFTSRRKRLLEEVEDEEEEDGPEDPDDLVEAIVALAVSRADPSSA